MTMTVDKNIMEFENKGLGNAERSWIFWPLEVYRPCTSSHGIIWRDPVIFHQIIILKYDIYSKK
jgi:hypothetical protein